MTDKEELNGLGGWLILVGVGIVLSPLRLLFIFIPTYTEIFLNGTWTELSTKDSGAYNPYFSSLLAGEMVFNCIILMTSVYLIYLFFTKHYLFPKVYICLITATLIFIPLDAYLVSAILPDIPMFDPDTTKEFMRSGIAAIIWIPYMLVSKRVKATFIQKKPLENLEPASTY